MSIVRHERKTLPFKHNIEHRTRRAFRNDKFKKYLSGATFL